ncbi:ankyrin repeat-containing domain protein, partial [Coprinopsis sp. MPI-PUGE-AT-0042]
FDPTRMVPEALLLSVCCGLVSIDEKTKLVRLIHYTTRDAILPQIQNLHPVPHAILAHVCIAHVASRGFQNCNLECETGVEEDAFQELLHGDLLLAYAYRSWVHHTRQCLHHTPILVAASALVVNSTNYPLENERTRLDFGGPLHIAAFYGIEELIPPASQAQTPYVQTTFRRASPLMLAVKVGHLACAQTLLSLPGIDANLRDITGKTTLMQAAANGHVECVQLLVEVPGIDINARDNNGWTALIHAASGGHTPILKLLCEVPGIDINTADNCSQTALIHAVAMGNTETAKLLIGLPGINVNAAEDDGWTALMHAVWENLREAVKLLCEVPGIEINAVDNDGWTALIYAARWGCTEAAKLLLDVPGIDVTIVDKQGKTTLSRALEEGHKEIADLLLAFPG